MSKASRPVALIARVHDGVLYLDLRCLNDEDGFLNQLDQLAGRDEQH